MRIYDDLIAAAQELPDKAALEFMGRPTTYGALADEARRFAAGLARLGVGPGHAVGLMLPNLPHFVTALYGSWMAGAHVTPFNVLLRPGEIRYQLEDSRTSLIVVYELFLAHVLEAVGSMERPPRVVVVGRDPAGQTPYADLLAAEPAEPHPSEPGAPAQIIYTSGTTGKPKGAVITHANVLANLAMMDAVFERGEADKYLCVLPLFHVFALNGVLVSTIRNCATVVLHPKFEVAEAVRSLVEDGITTFAGVPTMYFYLLKHPEVERLRFPRLRQCFSGGAAMPVEVMKQFEDLFDVPIYEGFGLTETTVSVCCNRPDRTRRPGSIGLPYDGVEMKVIDDAGREQPHGEVGEIIIRAPNVMAGYLNKPDATAEAIKDGWFYSGDLGYRDDEGYFYIVDRKKDMIIKGGYNIYPREIEEVIYQLPQVAEAAVVGVFDEAKGEVVRAVVALKPGQALPEEALRAHVEANLAKYKWPLDYLFVDELPKGPTGKILKRELRAQWAQWNKDRLAPSPHAGA